MAQKVTYHKYVKYTCSKESVQQNGRFTLYSSKFLSNIYSILFVNFIVAVIHDTVVCIDYQV